jgi:hypothetical protein
MLHNASKYWAAVFFLFIVAANNLLAQSPTFTRVDATLGIVDSIGRDLRGCAWVDFDNDGDPDLLTIGNDGAEGKPNLFFRNDGSKFVEMAVQVGLADLLTQKYAIGASAADIDNDGDLDVCLINRGVRLYRNDGGKFVLISNQVGLTLDQGLPMYGCPWGDYDKDGDVDLLVTGNNPDASGYSIDFRQRIYRNDGGKFVELGDQLGVFAQAEAGYGGNWVDYDNDGDLDLWIGTLRSNPYASLLYRNDGGTFSEVTVQAGLAAEDVVGSVWADFDNDGDLDMYIVSFDGSVNDTKHKLFRNELLPTGQPTFTNIAPALGMDITFRSRGASWGDFDNDGDLDLLVPSYDNNPANILYRNNLMETGQATFTNLATQYGLRGIRYERTPIWVDYDKDGFLDLWINGERTAGIQLYHNNKNSNNWARFECLGGGPPTGSSRDGIGARVRVVSGNLKQIREINGGMETWSQAPLIAHFGLGNRTKIDTVVVRWARGRVDVMTNVPINRLLTIKEGRGIVSVPKGVESTPQQYSLFQNYPNPFNPSTEIKFQIPVAGLVQLKLYDVLGREIATLVNEWKEAGSYSVTFDSPSANNSTFGILPSGVYFYRMNVHQFTDTKKAILLR